MRIIAIIPARRGSKGIPKKNLRLLGSKSLIEYTIGSAKLSKKFDRIIVSTDDEKIAQISQRAGAEILFKRPKKISKDYTKMIDVIKHTLTHLKKNESYFPEMITLLQPTSPFRDKNMIKKSINLLQKPKTTCVVSVMETKHHPNISFQMSGKFLKPFNKNLQNQSIRQKRMPLFYPTGSLYTFWTKNLKKYNSMYGPRILPLVIRDEMLNIDIDDWYDLFMAEMTQKFWIKYTKPKSKN